MQIITIRTLRGMQVQIEAGQHLIIADEAGAESQGPDPCSLLLASLGASTAMHLREYAQERGWELELEVVLVKGSDGIRRRIRVEGNLSAEQRQELLSTARNCPVYKMLAVEVRDTLL